MLNALKTQISRLFHLPGQSHPKYNWKHFYYGIFLIPLVLNPFAIQAYEIPKQSWMMVFVGIFLLLSIIAFLAAKKWRINVNKWLFAVIALWILSYALSTIFAVAPIEAFWGDFERMSGFLTNFYYILHFLICLNLFSEEKEQDIFINMAIVLGCILSFHAILQWLRIDPLQIGNIDEASGRSYATIGQPSLFGQWLIAPLFAAGFRIFNSKNTKKVLFASATALITVGLILSLNRASILAVIVTLGLILLYKYRITPAKKISIITAVVAVGIILIIVFGGSLRSFYTRINLWESSLPLVTDNIVIGSGLESYYQTIQTVLTKEIYLTETLYNMPGNVHFETYQILLEQGIFGLLLYLLSILFLGWVFFKEKAITPNAKIALFTLIASIISLQFSFAGISQIIFMLAFWAILLKSTIKFRAIKISPDISVKLTVFVLIVALSSFSVMHAFSISKSNQLITNGVEQYFTDYNQAFKTLEEAVWINPNYTYLHYTAIHFLASKEEIGKNTENALILRENLSKMGNITNNSFKYHLSAATLELADGNEAQSYQEYQKAAQKAPNYPAIYQEWGNSAYEQKDYETAVKQYENLMELAPFYWRPPTSDQGDPEYAEKHRIFKKTHQLYYMAMKNLVGAYGSTGQDKKASDLIQLIK